jgi:hypothetical protein
MSDYYDDDYSYENGYVCIGDFTTNELIKELKKRSMHEIIVSDNLYEMQKIEILKEFFNKYNLEQIQDVKELLFDFEGFYDDMQTSLHLDEAEITTEGLDAWIKMWKPLYERLNKRG